MSMDLALPYEGDSPYLFASYCHKDEDIVLPVLRFLQEEGVRLWYDTGIDPGTEWPEVIANHLDQSSVFLAFLSSKSQESHNCRKEFNFALMKNMPSLSVILEPIQFTPVMKLQMSSVQAIYYYECEAKEFQEKLLKMPALSVCRDAVIAEMRYYLRRVSTSERVMISHSNFKIGRKAGLDLCDYAVEDQNKYVGKVHAIFDITDDGLSVRDDSLNHTYVTDGSTTKKLLRGDSCTLKAGDLVSLGFEYEKFVIEIEEIRSAE